MDDNNFRKLIQIVEDNSEIKKEGGLSEGTGEVVKKVFKHKGKPVGEIGVDLASSPGGGMYYMKYYGSGRAVSGYDSMEEAFAELKHYLNQMKEGATGETESTTVAESKWEVAIEYGPTAHHTAKITVSAPDADTAQTKALSIFKKKFPDRRGMVGDYTELK